MVGVLAVSIRIKTKKEYLKENEKYNKLGS
jgi:hypothetical protein